MRFSLRGIYEAVVDTEGDSRCDNAGLHHVLKSIVRHVHTAFGVCSYHCKCNSSSAEFYGLRKSIFCL